MSRPSGGTPDYHARNGEMWRAWMHGESQASIGQRYGLTQSRVSEILREIRQSMPQVTRDEMIERERAYLDNLRQIIMDLAGREGAPVTAGKDGFVVRDPDSGEVVRDYSLRVAAVREGRALNERLSRMLGLDAAQRVDITTTQATAEAEQAAAEAAAFLAEGGQTDA